MVTTLYVVRHAEAAGNRERFFQGHTDGMISDKGRKQLECLAKRFEEIKIDALYCSPLTRARETAQAVNRAHGLPINTDENLIEIDGGVWEGRPWTELPTLYPEQARLWMQQPWLFHPENGEAMTHVRRRMAQAITDIAARHPGESVAVVSHGCAIRAMLSWAKGWPIERLNEVEWCDNTGICKLLVDGDSVTLEYENDCTHLTEELSTFAGQRWWRKEERGNMVFDD